MSVSPEELAAFADGELDPARRDQVAKAIASDPRLSEQVRTHQALREGLTAHFVPIFEAPTPARLMAPLQRDAEVVDLAAVRAGRMRKAARWTWIVGPALAASIALAVFLPRGSDYAHGALESTLDQQLVAQQSGREPVRVLLTFRDGAGEFCRAFAGEAQSGIACRDEGGWRMRMKTRGISGSPSEYRMAGSPALMVLETAQTMAHGPALTAREELNAMVAHWR